MIPAYYEFSCPVKILSGHTALDNLPSELFTARVTRPMLLTDAGVLRAGLLRPILEALSAGGITTGAYFDQVQPESSTLLVNELASLYRTKQCNGLIAVGGGSVIDTAKGVNILASLGGEDVRRYCGVETLPGPLLPFFAIPTTSGTGSEVTNTAVIYDPDRNIKMAFVSEFLIPRAAILDTRMTLTMPPLLTASTGMDALAHAMEAFIGIQKNPMSDAYAWQAITLVGRHLVQAARTPADKDCRLALANAAAMAGMAFSNSMVGCVHALAHAAGAIAQIPHGEAISIFLPVGLEYNLPARAAMIGELLLPLAGSEVYASTPPNERPRRAIMEVRKIKDSLHAITGLPRTLQEAGIERKDFDAIARLAINDGSVMMNPIDMNEEDARRLLEKTYTGDNLY